MKRERSRRRRRDVMSCVCTCTSEYGVVVGGWIPECFVPRQAQDIYSRFLTHQGLEFHWGLFPQFCSRLPNPHSLCRCRCRVPRVSETDYCAVLPTSWAGEWAGWTDGWMCDSYPFCFFFLALRFGADTFRQRLDDLRSLGAESMPISDCWRILSVAQGESEREHVSAL